jgi:hypothetical protein
MDLAPFGYAKRRDAVVILGAGASRGASFSGAESVLKPPLDTDFFTQLKASPVGQEPDGQRLLAFLDQEFGDADVSMEAFYSQVHLHDQFVADLPRGKGRRRTYAWAMRYFLRVIPPLFGSCIGTTNCKWHDALVGAMDARDCILSFNYDCIADRSLKSVARRKWDPGEGYGVVAAGDLNAWKDHTGTGRFPKTGHFLLKPHGSLNWCLDEGQLKLLPDPYERREEGALCIVPPLWQKSFDASPFHDIWLKARRYLTATKALIVVGYSLPTTDVYTQAMLRIDVQELDFLLIANPDNAARARLKRVLRSALAPTTRVVELDGLSDIGKLLGRSAPLERIQARLTGEESLAFRAGDVQAVLAQGHGDDLVRFAQQPTARSGKQRQLAMELLALGETDRAVLVARAIENRAEALNLVKSAADLFQAHKLRSGAVEALSQAISPNLDDHRRRILHELLRALDL